MGSAKMFFDTILSFGSAAGVSQEAIVLDEAVVSVASTSDSLDGALRVFGLLSLIKLVRDGGELTVITGEELAVTVIVVVKLL